MALWIGVWSLMKKHDLLRSGDNIIRVLDVQQESVLVIDCVKQTMPVWMESAWLESHTVCSNEELFEITGIRLMDADALDADQRKVMHERYTMIAPIVSLISDDKIRPKLICSIAEECKVSRQTVRKYLCLYLSYLDLAVLAPKKRQNERELTQDEKNIRWALNKYFHTTKKQSLMTAYTMMLKEKYCDALGVLAEKYPSFYQFRYFYRKTRKMQNFYISRNGLKNYQRNNRPLTGEGVREFALSVGVGMLDATVCDIYLVNDAGSLVGRPILTACIDAYSSLCCGYSLSWEGGVCVETALSSQEALQASGLDWNVIQRPIMTSAYEPILGYKANIRDTDNKVLGVVSDRYRVVQNAEAFAFTDALLGEGVKYETAGSLQEGRRIWLLAKLPDRYIIEGEQIEPYLVFSSSHDGSGAIKAAMTPVRVVCQNTLNMALSTAKRVWSTVHVGDLAAKMDEAHNTLLLAEKYMGKLGTEIAALSKIRLSDSKVMEYIDMLLPMDDQPSDIHKKNISRIREDLKIRYFDAPDLKHVGKNGYRFICAVSDFVTHAKPIRETANYRENLFAKTIEGNPMIDRAYEMVRAA